MAWVRLWPRTHPLSLLKATHGDAVRGPPPPSPGAGVQSHWCSAMSLTANIRLAPIVAGINRQKDWEPPLERCRILYGMWGKDQKLRDQIFEKRKVHAPSFHGTPSAEIEHTHLYLRCATVEYLTTSADVPADDLDSLLSCLTNHMLVTEAYAEAFAYLSQRDAKRDTKIMPIENRQQSGDVLIEFGENPNSRTNAYQAVIMTGQPGIGKTWFLYVLVERLLRAETTVVQVAADFHISLDQTGVSCSGGISLQALRNSDTWALCDRQPLGLANRRDAHQWFILVASRLFYLHAALDLGRTGRLRVWPPPY